MIIMYFYFFILCSISLIFGIKKGWGLLYWVIFSKDVISLLLSLGFFIRNEVLRYFIWILICLGFAKISVVFSLLNLFCNFLRVVLLYCGSLFLYWGGRVGLMLITVSILSFVLLYLEMEGWKILLNFRLIVLNLLWVFWFRYLLGLTII